MLKLATIKVGDEVIFHEEIADDIQGRFLTAKITFLVSKKTRNKQLRTKKWEDSFYSTSNR